MELLRLFPVRRRGDCGGEESSRPVLSSVEIRDKAGAEFFQRRQFTDQLLVRERPVALGGVEVRDAALDGLRISEMASCLSMGEPYAELIPMQPSPMADTSRLLFPSLRFCTVFLL
jgi:hypothetical protein